jgi:endosialidase-like protein
MKTKLHFLFSTVALLAFSTFNSQFSTVFAQGTAFTYQGQLASGGLPANGSYDLTFALFNASSGGVQSGVTLTNTATAVSNGLFAVTLDFGGGIFNGTSYWLAVGVRTNGGGTFTALTPLQQILPVPYAVYSANAGTSVSATTAATANTVTANSVTAASIASGQVVKSLNGLHDAVVLAAGSNIALSTNGNTLTVSTPGGGWGLLGNAGTTAGVNFVGTTDNQPLEFHVNGQRVFRLEPTTGNSSFNVIGGSPYNSTTSAISATISGGYANNIAAGLFDSSIGGGYFNNVQANYSTIAGGWENNIQGGANYSTIGGGGGNTNFGAEATIAGGVYNLIQAGANWSTIGGGDYNTNSGIQATIGGGVYNTVQSGGTNAFIGGGVGNINSGAAATVGGGIYNNIQAGANYSTIAGGDDNLIDTNSPFTFIFTSPTLQFVSGAWSTVGGGLWNTISSGGSVIGGGLFNVIDTNSSFSSVNFGGRSLTGGFSVVGGGLTNTVSAGASFIGGGGFNWIEPNAQWSAIGGGEGNMIDTNSYISTIYISGSRLQNLSGGFSFIGGGAANKIRTDTSYIGGGDYNLIDTNSSGSVISGGSQNVIRSGTSAIGGGNGNLIDVASFLSTIGGGGGNAIHSANSFIGGGGGNVINTNATGAFIGGGDNNKANGGAAVIPGGDYNVANGTYSFAAGNSAQATNDYTFVWNDGPSAFTSTAAHQFLIHAISGVGINSQPNTNTYQESINAFPYDLSVAHGISADYVNVSGTAGITAYAIKATNGTSLLGSIFAYGNGQFLGSVSATAFNVSSDRNVKENFRPVDDQAMLAKVAALPMTEWNYKQDSSGVQHIGPMAQDFQAAFGLNGEDDKHISLVDEGGVALAAIQGLNQKIEQQDRDKDAEIQTLKQQNDSLAKRLSELEATVRSLAQSR